MPSLVFVGMTVILGIVGVTFLVLARRLQSRINRDEWTKPITFQSDLMRADRIALVTMGYLFGIVFCAASVFFFVMEITT